MYAIKHCAGYTAPIFTKVGATQEFLRTSSVPDFAKSDERCEKNNENLNFCPSVKNALNGTDFHEAQNFRTAFLEDFL
jgi:hypothetical protein